MLKKIVSFFSFLGVMIFAKSASAIEYKGVQTTGNDLMGYVEKGINIFIGIAGVLSVVFIIMGGFQYITSGTSKDGTTKAKNTITYAIIGLIIVVLALVIRNFVLQKFLGVNVNVEEGLNAL